MLLAGDGHHIGPVGWCHDHSGDLGAGDVEGGGTVLVRALDAGAAVLIGTVAVAEHTLLQWKQKIKTLVGDSGRRQIRLDLLSLFLLHCLSRTFKDHKDVIMVVWFRLLHIISNHWFLSMLVNVKV